MQYSNLHTHLIQRLFAAWIVLSLIIGGIVYYLETKEINNYIVNLVLQDAKTFDPKTLDKINSPEPGVVELYQHKIDALLERHYSLVDVYDLNQAHVAAAERELESNLRNIIEPRHHKFPLDKQLHYEKFEINDELFLQALVPLQNSENVAAGYMEAVYHIEDEVLDTINRRIFRSLILVVVIILSSTLVLYPIILRLNRRLYKFSHDMLHTNLELIDVLGNAIAVRDKTTNSHNYRVTLYAVRLGEAVNINNQDMRSLIAGSFLHDVGKIGIRDEVLSKPESLTEKEIKHMREHVIMGLNIIGSTEWLEGAKDIIEFHHEHYNGKGYQRGLKGEEIPLIARIFSIADVFDALTSQRPYKEALGFDEAMKIIENKSGSHLDPQLVSIFKRIAKQVYKEISAIDEESLEQILTETIDRYYFINQVF